MVGRVGSGIRHDYKIKSPPAPNPGRVAPRGISVRLSRHHVAAGVSLAVVAGLMALWLGGPAEGKQATESQPGVADARLPLPPLQPAAAENEPVVALAALVEPAQPEPLQPEPPAAQRTLLEVKPGDSLDVLFRRHGLSVSDLHYLLKVAEAAPHLRRVRPGDTFEIVHDGPAVLSMSRRIDETRTLLVNAGENGFSAEFLEHPVEVRLARASGQIDTSFYAAGLAAGLSDATIMRLAGIYAWDIDFALEIRRNDWFTVVYEEIWQDGEKLRDGQIVAVEFHNQGRSYRAVRFPDADGRPSYYTPAGDSMRKAFLRAPVDFSRVSSNFNPNRLHPILKTRRPHRGVDYAARSGTPIMAAGDGRVITAGNQSGYGKTVVLQHGGNVTTLYAHMSRIKARVGTRVKQGDIIGYVGMTGLATAPHLHYEYRVNGVHKNPRTVELPQAEPVPAARRTEFAAVTTPLLKELDSLSLVRLAATD
jgi:murein DD-endopeptidase MepM/ murein hydrolase activator NlpD